MHLTTSAWTAGPRHLFIMFWVLFSSAILADPADDFVTTWKTDNLGSTGPTSIRIPFLSGLYDVDWDNDGVFEDPGLSFIANHDFGVAGTYTIRVRGDFGGINFDGAGDIKKLVGLSQWGTTTWTTAHNLFKVAINEHLFALRSS